MDGRREWQPREKSLNGDLPRPPPARAEPPASTSVDVPDEGNAGEAEMRRRLDLMSEDSATLAVTMPRQQCDLLSAAVRSHSRPVASAHRCTSSRSQRTQVPLLIRGEGKSS